MKEIFAQGDVLFERVADVPPSGTTMSAASDGSVTVAEGEATGHRHRFYDAVVMFRDDALAWDIPADLYIGHVKIEGNEARLLHDEHAPLILPRGTWRVRRQRELEPNNVRYVAD